MTSEIIGAKIMHKLKDLRKRTHGDFSDEWLFYPEEHGVHIQIKSGEGDFVEYSDTRSNRNLILAMCWFYRNTGLKNFLSEIHLLKPLLDDYRGELSEERKQ